PDCIASQSVQQGLAVGAAVPLTAFAEAHLATAAGSARLRPSSRVTDDGAQELVGIVDTARGSSCSATIAGDGVLRCLPDDGAFAFAFADPDCRQVALGSADASAVPPTLAYTLTSDACPARRLYTVGARMTLTTIYESQGGI